MLAILSVTLSKQQVGALSPGPWTDHGSNNLLKVPVEPGKWRCPKTATAAGGGSKTLKRD